MSFTVIGISHHQAPIEIREIFYRSLEQTRSLLSLWATEAPQSSFIILSTCNRLELYTDLRSSDKQFQKCVEDLSFSRASFYEHSYCFEGRSCVEHLFKVACALDSKIIGENQIIGQIKQAFHLSREHGCLHHQIQRLFEQAFYWARQVKSQMLELSRSQRSWGEVAASWLNQNTKPHTQRCILIIGAGKTIEQCLEYYDKKAGDRLTLCNRSIDNLAKLRYASEATLISIQSLKEHLRSTPFDVVVIATSSSEPLIWADDLMMHPHAMTLIDLSLPRNTDPKIALLPSKNVLLLDNLPIQNQIPKGKELPCLQQAVDNFMSWMRHDLKRDTIKLQRAKVAKTQQYLLEKALKKLQRGGHPQEVLKIFGHQLTQKLLHESPVAITQDMIE